MKLRAFVTLAVIAAPAHAQFAAPIESDPAAACANLARIELPELVELDAEWRPAGPFELAPSATGSGAASTLPEFCRVRGLVLPAIGFEVWLPAPADWNGRFLGVGGGGFTGAIVYSSMLEALRAGYATASTDTGHTAGDLDWLGDDGLLRDYGYRGVYEMTAKAESLVTAFYERPADYRYFNGCSTGGRQGLMQAERYPDDYDGIVAGDPVNAFVAARATLLWAARAAQPSPGAPGLLSRETLARVNAAVIAQCDTLDGVSDGVLEDPRRCNFDPGRLQCGIASGGVASGSSCLQADQVGALRQIYAGPSDASSGLRLPGFAAGSETGWTFAQSEDLSPLALEFFRRAVFDDLNWDWRSFDFPADYARAEEEVGWIMNASAADLGRFRDHGGKLILYHGWNDASVSPEASIAYYEALEARLDRAPAASGSGTRDFARLFLVPGMGHCGGGVGTGTFDAQRAIEDWVERGIAPDRIEATRLEDGESLRSRPLCPYPQTAQYRGTGNTERSGSFVCAE